VLSKEKQEARRQARTALERADEALKAVDAVVSETRQQTTRARVDRLLESACPGIGIRYWHSQPLDYGTSLYEGDSDGIDESRRDEVWEALFDLDPEVLCGCDRCEDLDCEVHADRCRCNSCGGGVSCECDDAVRGDVVGLCGVGAHERIRTAYTYEVVEGWEERAPYSASNLEELMWRIPPTRPRNPPAINAELYGQAMVGRVSAASPRYDFIVAPGSAYVWDDGSPGGGWVEVGTVAQPPVELPPEVEALIALEERIERGRMLHRLLGDLTNWWAAGTRETDTEGDG
jgi:hypothetical protein